MTRTDAADSAADKTIRNPLFIVFLALMIVIGVLAYVVVQLRGVVESNTAEQRTSVVVSEQNRRILEEVQSCTTPDGACAQRGAASGNNLSSAIVYCTLNLPENARRDQVTNCIVRQIKEGLQ